MSLKGFVSNEIRSGTVLYMKTLNYKIKVSHPPFNYFYLLEITEAAPEVMFYVDETLYLIHIL
jgi:hypothetical protein